MTATKTAALRSGQAQTAGNTLVLGLPGGFVPLKDGKSSSGSEAPDEA